MTPQDRNTFGDRKGYGNLALLWTHVPKKTPTWSGRGPSMTFAATSLRARQRSGGSAIVSLQEAVPSTCQAFERHNRGPLPRESKRLVRIEAESDE